MLIVLFLSATLGCEAREQKAAEALQKCDIGLIDVRIVSLGFTSASLELVFSITNPNSISVTFDRADYDLYGSEKYLGHGFISRKVNIPPSASRTVSSPFEVLYSDVGKVAWDILRGENVSWKITGKAYINTPKGEMEVPLELNL